MQQNKTNQDFFYNWALEPKNASVFHYNLMGLLYARMQQKSCKSHMEFQAFVQFEQNFAKNFFSCNKTNQDFFLQLTRAQKLPSK